MISTRTGCICTRTIRSRRGCVVLKLGSHHGLGEGGFRILHGLGDGEIAEYINTMNGAVGVVFPCTTPRSFILWLLSRCLENEES